MSQNWKTGDLRRTDRLDRETLLAQIAARGGVIVEEPQAWWPPIDGTFHVIGFVLWDPPEVQILQQLNARTCSGLVLFDLDHFLTQEAIELTFPGMSPVIETPVLAEYAGGKLSWCKQGREALGWLSDRFVKQEESC